MTTQFQATTEQHLKSYLALVDYWDAEAGDTHELLGSREVLHDRIGSLSKRDLQRLMQGDDLVLSLVKSAKDQLKSKRPEDTHISLTWDVSMLLKTADLIVSERSSRKLAA